MKDITKKWFEFAKADLDFAEQALSSPRPTHWTFLLILWHCHQTIEKALKAVLIEQDKKLILIHDLPELLKKVDLSTISEENKNILFRLNKYYIRSRYPDLIYSPFPKTNKATTVTLFNQTKVVYQWLKKQL